VKAAAQKLHFPEVDDHVRRVLVRRDAEKALFSRARVLASTGRLFGKKLKSGLSTLSTQAWLVSFAPSATTSIVLPRAPSTANGRGSQKCLSAHDRH